MHIKLKNKYLVTLIPFLQGMKLKGEKSRARSKFLELATAAFTSLQDSETELVKEYAAVDSEGEPLIKEDGSFTLRKDTYEAFINERAKLFDEIAEIEGGTYTTHLGTMRQILNDYDEELDGENAELYDALCDAFEEASE